MELFRPGTVQTAANISTFDPFLAILTVLVGTLYGPNASTILENLLNALTSLFALRPSPKITTKYVSKIQLTPRKAVKKLAFNLVY